MRALQMFFRVMRSKGLSSPCAYKVARFAVVNRCSLYIAVYSMGGDPDIFQWSQSDISYMRVK